MKVYQLIHEAEKQLERVGIVNAKQEAVLLLRFLLGWEFNAYLLHRQQEVSLREETQFQALLQKRLQRVPLQYITGTQEFMSREFNVTPAVLIPRHDTEVLVQAVLDIAKDLSESVHCIEVCTGSGIVAITLAKTLPGWKITAVDISEDALAVAKINAKRHGAEVTFVKGDLLTSFTEDAGAVQVIAANPPYIASEDFKTLMPELSHEPSLALEGGKDGLDVYRELIPQAADRLEAGGWLVLEIGAQQGTVVESLCKQEGFSRITIIQDYQGLDRVVAARKG